MNSRSRTDAHAQDVLHQGIHINNITYMYMYICVYIYICVCVCVRVCARVYSCVCTSLKRTHE